jgi:hypothetical protein
VHELCHQWLYLIEEVWALESPGARRVTLPSGTPGRSPADVVGAAHVAIALIRLYRASGGAPPGRTAHLADYGDQCLRLLDRMDHDLTDAGLDIARRLREAL